MISPKSDTQKIIKSNRFFSPWWGPAMLLLGGIAAFVWKVKICGDIKFIGFGDPAAYAEMAHSIITGRWLEVDYISMFYLKFDPGVSHPDETWPPLYSFLIAPFFLFMGKTAFAAKLPSLIFSSLCFPLVTYALAKHALKAVIPALAAGFSILLFEPVFGWSLNAMPDTTLGFMICLSIFMFLKGLDRKTWFIPMGFLLGLCCYLKGTSMVFVLALAAYYMIRRGLGFKPTSSDKFFALGMAVFLLVLTPWFVRNTVHFDHPLYSTHKHVMGFVGWSTWEETTYSVYWDKEPPSITDKLKRPAKLLEKTGIFLLRNMRLLFLKSDSRSHLFAHTELAPFKFLDISTYWIGIPALIGAVFYLGSKIRRKETSRFPKECGLFLFVIFAFLLFLSLFWVPTSRLFTPIIPLVMIMGWGTIHILAKRFAALAVLLAFFIWAGHEVMVLSESSQTKNYPWRDKGKVIRETGDWFKRNAPGSVVMTWYPWSIHFYSESKTVHIPIGDLEDLIKVAAHYRVTHLVDDNTITNLKMTLRNGTPGVRKVAQIRAFTIYALDVQRISAWFKSIKR